MIHVLNFKMAKIKNLLHHTTGKLAETYKPQQNYSKLTTVYLSLLIKNYGRRRRKEIINLEEIVESVLIQSCT